MSEALYGRREQPCPTCHRMRRDQQCRNPQCPDFQPASPETVREALAAMRAALAKAREHRQTRPDPTARLTRPADPWETRS